jgi:hypothetical protein
VAPAAGVPLPQERTRLIGLVAGVMRNEFVWNIGNDVFLDRHTVVLV